MITGECTSTSQIFRYPNSVRIYTNMSKRHRYSLWMPPGEDMPFCSSERLCWSPSVSRVWICKHLLSLVAGLPGDTSGLMPGSWALGSRMQGNTSYFRLHRVCVVKAKSWEVHFIVQLSNKNSNNKNVPSYLIKTVMWNGQDGYLFD